jgi:hypothetical protein
VNISPGGQQWHPNQQHAVARGHSHNGKSVVADVSDSSKGAPLSSLASSQYSKSQPSQQNGHGHGGPINLPAHLNAGFGPGNVNDPSSTMASAATMVMQQPGAAAAAIAALQQQLGGMANAGNGSGPSVAALQQFLQQQMLQTVLTQAVQQNLTNPSAQVTAGIVNNGGGMNLFQSFAGVLQGQGSCSVSVPQAPTSTSQTGIQSSISPPLAVLSQQHAQINLPLNLMALAATAAANAQAQSQTKISDSSTSATNAVVNNGAQNANAFSAGGTFLNHNQATNVHVRMPHALTEAQYMHSERRVSTPINSSAAVGESGQPTCKGEEKKIHHEPCMARKMTSDHNAVVSTYCLSHESCLK